VLGSLFSPLPAPTIVGPRHRVDTKIFFFKFLETQKKTSFTTEREEDWVPRFYGNRIINPLESCGPKVFLFSGSAKLTLAFPPPSFLPSSHIFLNGKVMSWFFLDKPLLKSKGMCSGSQQLQIH
jgi:hypothetical protein